MGIEFVQFSIVRLYRKSVFSGYNTKRPEDFDEKGCAEVAYAIYIKGEYFRIGSSSKSLLFPSGHNKIEVQHD